jgi:pimeloyl-ACP methyl ester carboxylesterase
MTAPNPNANQSPTKTGYAPVNNLRMYYEIHGTNTSTTPLILLHGGLCSTATFTAILPALSANRQVIVTDFQAHGRTADIDRPISPANLADDVAALAKHLQIEKVDVMGYSLGGATAQQTIFRHPTLVRKLVVVSSPYKRAGWYPEVRAAMDQMGPALAEQMKPSPLYKQYAAVAPNPDDWTNLIAKISVSIKKDYDWTTEVQAIQSPTMLVCGDADGYPPSHAAEFFQLLGGGKKDAGWDNSGLTKHRLAILPGITHYSMNTAPGLPAAAVPFLDAPLP